MTRLLLMVAISLVCAVMIGCSAPPVNSGRDVNQVVHKADTAPTTIIEGDALPSYESVGSLSGEITSIGDSTTTNLVARIAAEFRRMYPDVKMQVTASRTSISLATLLEGRADLVPMSQPLTPEDIQNFTSKYGYPPTEIKVAADALAIYVEKGNPVSRLTLEQLDGIFSQMQRRGDSLIETWDQIGLTTEWADRRINLYGYGPDNGAHQIFQQQVLNGGAFRLSLRVEGGGSSIVQGIAADPGAIGFASIFFACKRVRVVQIAGADGCFYAPTEENVRSQKYPLSRFLYIYVNKPPRQPLGGPEVEFLRFLLSREGQQIVADGGNIPLDVATVEQGRRMLAERSVEMNLSVLAHKSSVTIGLCDIKPEDSEYKYENRSNEIVARVNSLAFKKTEQTPTMAIKVASIAKEGKSAGFFGFIKGAIANMFITPPKVTKLGNTTMLEFGDALLQKKPTFTFPKAENIKESKVVEIDTKQK